jgi:pimeloyl-ACP methyl ester carboxylesterase
MEGIASQRIKSSDAEIVYWILGEGPPVVLLHPFPVHHEFWLPVANGLAARYRVIMPDLRGMENPMPAKARRRWKSMPPIFAA